MSYTPPAMTVAQMDALLEFLPAFTPDNYDPWGPSQPYDFYNALPYNNTVRAFRNTYMDVCQEIHPYHRLPEDGPDVEESTALFKQFGTVAAMQTASANQIRRLLMLCTRGERFGFSSTGDLLAAGVITAALHRLQELRAELIAQQDSEISADSEESEEYDDYFRLTTSFNEMMELSLKSPTKIDLHTVDRNPYIFWVGRVKWNGPHSPELYYTPFRQWKKIPTDSMLARARQAALRDRRFFVICKRCKQINNVGHMHDSNICQGCAERYLGVVY